ncbi:malonyl-CoA decarboxylase [Bradyrhizobium sp.]|uniref:malonyl-CoA decarboxylase n=1 Tax=Bradyrhizobium sp. TaxID=376 RepID=UPI0039E24964
MRLTEAAIPTISEVLRAVADRGRALAWHSATAGTGGDHLLELAEQLLSERGEATSIALSLSILRGYDALDLPARRGWLSRLAVRFGPDLAALKETAQIFLQRSDEDAATRLLKVAEPRRQELLRRFNHAPGGTHALVRMREDIMGAVACDPALAAFEGDFVHLFTSWFNRGFLQLRRIDWTTPATILEKIIRYEAVHAIDGWDELRRRIDPPDRRLYAFLHPALGDEPLIFVEVALTTEMPSAIGPLLAADRSPIDAAAATTAVFYSISNAQRGLSGVAFGNLLIKQVVEELRRELPRLTQFTTLSPVPGFAAWLRDECANPASRVIAPQARRRLALLAHANWPRRAAARDILQRALLPLAAHYFLHARSSSGRVIDPVARFHLGNGARLERINPIGDLSAAGMRQSHGLMVNYLYDLNQVAANHEAFVGYDEVVTSAEVRRHARSIVRQFAREPSAKGSPKS